MIVIDILNAEQITEKNTGKFKLKIAKVLGVNLKKRVEASVASQFKKELEENGLQVDVWVEERDSNKY